MESKSLITVNGRADLSITPDTTLINLSLEKVLPTNEEASQMAAFYLKKVGDVMETCSLDRNLPKTTHFSINKSYHSVYKDGAYTGEQKLEGYKFTLHIQIELDVNNDILTRIVQGIGQHLQDMDISISFSVKDAQSYQLKLLEDAVKDATEKARVLAAAAGCSLGQVASIEYPKSEWEYISSKRNVLPQGSLVSFELDNESFDFTPEAIEVHEDVTVQWYLKGNN